MAELSDPLRTPFLTNWQSWRVTQSQLEVECTLACRALYAILKDGARLDATAANPNTKSILDLLKYFEGALNEVYMLPNTSAPYQQAFRDFSNEIRRFKTYAHYGDAPSQIPSSTATELLLRLLLEKAPRFGNGNPTITSIDELVVAWNRKCRNTSNILQQDNRGLPKVLMICAGHNHPYSFVFATTTAYWENYHSIRDWCRHARVARLDPTELGNHTDRFTRFHNSVNKPTDYFETDRIRTRQNAIQNMPHADRYNHNGELARSIEIQPAAIDNPRNPNFLYAMQQRSRCFKCQGLYRWFVHNEVPTFTDGRYVEMSCAETLCNFFCSRVVPTPTAIAITAPALNAQPVGLAHSQTVTAPYFPPNRNQQRPWNLINRNQAMNAQAWQAL